MIVGVGFAWLSFGGDGGNRTRVRKRITKAFYERSFCFQSPAARRPKAGSGPWQPPGSWRGTGAAPSRTFTAHRRPGPSRGILGQDGCLVKQQQQQNCCRLILKVCGFKAVRAAARLPGLSFPVETFTSPFLAADCRVFDPAPFLPRLLFLREKSGGSAVHSPFPAAGLEGKTRGQEGEDLQQFRLYLKTARIARGIL